MRRSIGARNLKKLIRDSDRIFQLQLAIAWSQPIEYIENLNLTTFQEMKALNLLRPFTNDVHLQQQGYIASLLFNQNARKKSDLKSATDLFPYLDTSKIPDYLEDPIVLKCKQAMKSVNSGGMFNKALYDSVTDAIKVEISESIKDNDAYKLRELRKLLPKEVKNG